MDDDCIIHLNQFSSLAHEYTSTVMVKKVTFKSLWLPIFDNDVSYVQLRLILHVLKSSGTVGCPVDAFICILSV